MTPSIRRISLAAAGVTAALFLAVGCSRQQTASNQPANPPEPTATTKAKQAWADTKDAAQDAADKTADAAHRAADKTADAAHRAADSVADTAAATWDSVKSYTYDDRSKLRDTLGRMSDRIDSQVDEWRGNSGGLSDAAKEQWNRGVENLRQAKAELARELDKLDNATADTWDDTKASVGRAWDKVQQAYHDLQERARG